VTPTVHGVLGQTYRETDKTYKKMARAEVSAVRGNGLPAFMDGTEEDYETSGIMSADCKFGKFQMVAQVEKKTNSSGGRRLLAAEGEEKMVTEGGCVGFGSEILCE
jgi:hypothetical protein